MQAKAYKVYALGLVFSLATFRTKQPCEQAQTCLLDSEKHMVKACDFPTDIELFTRHVSLDVVDLQLQASQFRPENLLNRFPETQANKGVFLALCEFLDPAVPDVNYPWTLMGHDILLIFA